MKDSWTHTYSLHNTLLLVLVQVSIDASQGKQYTKRMHGQMKV